MIDEKRARRAARAMGLPVKGALGILLAAVHADLLPKQEALESLSRLAAGGIRISPQWQAWFKDQIEQR